MADEQQQFQERTEEATPKRRQDARLEGQVARSMEFNSAAVLGAGMIALALSGPWMLRGIQQYMTRIYALPADLLVDTRTVPELLFQFGQQLVILLSPLMLAVMVAGVGSNLAQVGALFTTKTVEPKWSRLNPIKGIGNLFSARSLVELVKSLLKVGLVGLVVYLFLSRRLPEFLQFGYLEPERAGSLLAFSLLQMTAWALSLLLVMAVADFAWQRFDTSRQLRMTVQEVKEERKQTDGDPLIKGKLRNLQLQTAYNRMIADLPGADVVVTNPIHLAVALKYDPATMRAPRVIAKGRRKVAQRIKDLARENGIPVVENVPLARGLFKACDVGMEVPGELYRAVAELLAWVFRSRERRSA